MERRYYILKQFGIEAVEITPFIRGHINDTFIVRQQNGKRFLLQRINDSVFPDVEKLMQNIVNVTTFCARKIIKAGGDVERETLNVIPTLSGRFFYEDENGKYWRVYKFIENAKTYQLVEEPKQFYTAGVSIGRFQNMLADFPAEHLTDVIPKFHDTRNRFEQFRQAIFENKCNRSVIVKGEIDFAIAREKYVDKIVGYLESGKIPYRVTHNDTKLNNIMIDSSSDEGICVIDLDTVMKGSMLYDFGDAIRSGATTAQEDETNLDKVGINMELFEVFAKGYLEQVINAITPLELENLAFSAILLTFECGLRFLTDFVNGDTYFKIDKSRPNHNLERARNQFKLVEDMEAHLEEMQEIVKKYSTNKNLIK